MISIKCASWEGSFEFLILSFELAKLGLEGPFGAIKGVKKCVFFCKNW